VVTRPLTPFEMGLIARRFLRMKLRTRIVRIPRRTKLHYSQPVEGNHFLHVA
jgi:hypothetical protein